MAFCCNWKETFVSDGRIREHIGILINSCNVVMLNRIELIISINAAQSTVHLCMVSI
jgi:hypothetical protein